MRAREFKLSFISLISLSTSSINCIIKSTSLCLSIVSAWKFVMRKEMSKPGIGFRLKMMKLSARPVIKRVNLWHKIFSISSACLIAMLTRTELIDGSIITRSLSFREIVSGVSKTSLDVLSCQVRTCAFNSPMKDRRLCPARCFHLRSVVALNNLRRKVL